MRRTSPHLHRVTAARRRVWRAGAVTAACLFTTSAARAADPLNSSNRGGPPETGPHYALDLLPIAGDSSDIGVVLGAIVSVSSLKPGREPYVWKLDASGVGTLDRVDGRLDLPYQEAFAKITLPRLLGTGAMLTIRPSYMWEKRLHYYGVGNASVDTPPAGRGKDVFLYGRRHTEAYAELQWPVWDHIAAKVGARFEHSAVQVEPDAKLAQDSVSPDPTVRRLVGYEADHWVGQFKLGVQWDDRNAEVSPHRGGWHQLEARVSPGGAGAFPYSYGQLDAILRFFLPVADSTTLALRLVGDALVGSPPFFELARFDDTYALGGALGVRGVPGPRYYGRVKVLGNVEVRVALFPFHAFGKELTFGVVGFLDGGRVWADFRRNPELDGNAIGLKYGVGGGLRLLSGNRFVVRADVAWSPDARPIGGYFGAGHPF